MRRPRLPAPGAWRRWAWRRLPGDCPLCGLRSRGAWLCAGCRTDVQAGMRSGSGRCRHCALRLPPDMPTCPDCVGRIAPVVPVVAAFDYEGPGQTLVRSFKRQGRFLMAPALAAFMHDAMQSAGMADVAWEVVPVPASDAALRRRGYNPAGELALALAALLGRPVRRGWLQRQRQDGGQTGRSRAARRADAAGRYVCVRPLRGASVLLVDDVLTTGSTVDDAARALRAAGAGSVQGVVAARTPWRSD